MQSIASLQSPLLQNLQRLNFLRACVLGTGILVVLAAHWAWDAAFDLAQLWLPGALWAALAALTAWRLARAWPVTEAEVGAHLCADVILLTGVLYATGGAGNPFVSLYLLPVVIAATTLSRAMALSLTLLAVACYSALVIYFVPLAAGEHAHHRQSFDLHVLGMWINFLVCAGLVLWIVARMTGALRDRDRELARAREKSLRDDKVLSLGLMAAGAAHELATPINTMSILLKEMSASAGRDAPLAADLETLNTQVIHCKGVIQGLAASAGQATQASVPACSLQRFLANTVERCQLLRPAVPISTSYQSAQQDAPVRADETLLTALTSLLSNAADASPQGVELIEKSGESELKLEILDRGPGISEESVRRAGRAFFTTKPEGKGFGIGLFLANATIERLGGSVLLLKRADGGTCTRIILPLVALRPTES